MISLKQSVLWKKDRQVKQRNERERMDVWRENQNDIVEKAGKNEQNLPNIEQHTFRNISIIVLEPIFQPMCKL